MESHLVNVHGHLSPRINPLERPHPLKPSSIGCGKIWNPHILNLLAIDYGRVDQTLVDSEFELFGSSISDSDQ